MAPPVDPSQPGPSRHKEPRGAGKVRERGARRAVQQTVEKVAAAARAQQVAEPWGAWDHQHGGVSMLPDARLGKGRRMHLLATTHGEVALETGTDAGRGVVKTAAGT